MSTAVKYLFDAEFGLQPKKDAKPVIELELHQKQVAAAEQSGYARGRKEGENDVTAQAKRRHALALERIGDTLGRLMHGLEAMELRIEAEALAVALAVARKLATELVAREPFAEIEALVRDAFADLLASPHLVITVAPDLATEAETELTKLAEERGFTGRLLVRPDPALQSGDCRIAFAEGGLARDRTALDQRIDALVTRYLEARGHAPAAGTDRGPA